MRCLQRNKSPFYYALFVEKVPLTDEYGNDTSEYEVVYGNPERCQANISAARGETILRQFGEDVAYDKVIVMDDTTTPIDEHSVLWVDTMPELDENGALAKDEDGAVITPWDYQVTKKARSLNSVLIAIEKVTISG